MQNKKLLVLLVALTLGLVVTLTMTTPKKSEVKPESSTRQTRQTSSSKAEKKKTEEKKEEFKVGVLQYVSHAALDEIYQGIQEGLAEAGYKVDDNLKLDFMNAEGNASHVQTMSKQLVENKNQVLVGIATPAAQGLAAATKELPIIMGAVTDPLGANLVQSIAEPGRNVTGVSDQTPITDAVQLIKTISGAGKTIGILYSSNEDNALSQVKTFTDEAELAGFKVVPYAIPSSNEIASTMTVMTSKVDLVWLPNDNTLAASFPTVVKAAEASKKPIYTSVAAMAKEGGLAAISLDQREIGIETGKLVAKALKGEDPAKTPVKVYKKGKIIINQAVADKLGISLSEEVLKTADQVLK